MDTPTDRAHAAVMYEVAFTRFGHQCRTFRESYAQFVTWQIASSVVLPLFAAGLLISG